MESGFWFGVLVGIMAGGGAVWYFKVLALQRAVLTMTGEYRRADRRRRYLEQEKISQQ